WLRNRMCRNAEQDLQECEELAQRGGMRLHLIDCHLEAARLALTAGQDILTRTAAEHLAAAKKGIDETGYKRRLQEVANIEGRMEDEPEMCKFRS
ncbi:MAG: hypothetical protein D3906_08180, partial [Candidatus Electrothrix sp. AUS1_2]|nr:hypothetical protein [Candidatus Electrothrix sp. AUS1_2]